MNDTMHLSNAVHEAWCGSKDQPINITGQGMDADCDACIDAFAQALTRVTEVPKDAPRPVITNEEALAVQRYDQELVALAVDQTLRAGGDLFRERARANRLEQENDRLSSFERRTRNPHGDWLFE